MEKSARFLGYECGLSAEEMNVVLEKKGYLQGEPGNYEVTEKGSEFAHEKNFHRGCGGSPKYNAYWTTRTWKDGILDDMQITEDDKQEARETVSERRAARKQSDILPTEDTISLDDAISPVTDTNGQSGDEADTNTDDTGATILGVLAIGVAIGAGYAIYKFAAPRIKRWWKKKNSLQQDETASEDKPMDNMDNEQA